MESHVTARQRPDAGPGDRMMVASVSLGTAGSEPATVRTPFCPNQFRRAAGHYELIVQRDGCSQTPDGSVGYRVVVRRPTWTSRTS